MKPALMVCALAVTVFASSSAFALPADRTITYEIHETPDDPQTAVEWVVELDLEAVDSKGAGDIGWEIQVITIRNEAETVDWSEVSPYLNGSDNLWWTNHADGNNPVAEEFTEPPLICGTAENASTDLDYDFEGTLYTPPPAPQQPPFVVTSSLSYYFHVVGELDPEEEEDEKPADVDDDDGDP